MSCTKCQLDKTVGDIAKKEGVNIPNSISRVVYERMKQLERNISNKPKTESLNKKTTRKMKKERIQRNSMTEPVVIRTKDQILGDYKNAFREELSLKLSPIKVFEDIQKIRDQLYNFEDIRRKYEYEYQKAFGYEDPDELLLQTRIEVRKEFQ